MTPGRGARRFRLITSLKQGPSDGTAFDGVRKHVDIAPRTTLRLCELEGAGRIVRLWITLPVLGRGFVLKRAVLRIYWDGEASPSVEVPLGDFFGASFGKPARLVSESLVVAGGAYLSRFEMPFNTRAILEIANDSDQAVRDLFFQVGYYEEPARAEPEPTLHACYRHEDPKENDGSVTLLQATGRGWLAGIKVDVQNSSWWLKLPLRDIVLPRGFGLGLLEGWETMVVDGDHAAPLLGTGAEDYFSGGFYFKGAPFCTPTHGCTMRSFLLGRVSAYRLHLNDPIFFADSMSVTLDHGLKNRMSGSYSSVAYWYQSEPHAPFPAFPPVSRRIPRWPWINVVQWVICAMMLAVLAAAVTCLINRYHG
jgi:D-arabinan exo alpha-(1,3)/(1,5)-arabinofuranosidase (non-reducing end)